MQDPCLQQRYSYAKIYGFGNGISYARSTQKTFESNNVTSAEKGVFLYEA
jgi:hypothetical protein